ncbi:MAG: hypothetical protein ACRC6E_05460 [Fusobacteriaceae bacterium]
MLVNFKELVVDCLQQIKGEPIVNEYGDITFPILDKVISCIPRYSISTRQEMSLGYNVDLILYTEEELLKDNEVIFEGNKYLLKRSDKKQGHYENYLVVKNV